MSKRIVQVALVGAILLVASSQARASANYLGGRVMPAVRIIPIFYGSNWASLDKSSTWGSLITLKDYIRGVIKSPVNPDGRQPVYAQYGLTGAQVDNPSYSVADNNPRVLADTDIRNIVHAFQQQTGISWSADKIFVVMPGPGYDTDYGTCGGRGNEGDGKYYAFVTHDCSHLEYFLSWNVLATAINPNWDAWINVLDPCIWHYWNFPDTEVALPWNNRTGACATSPWIDKASDELQVVVTTSTGGLFHTLRHADTTWTPFGDVKAAIGSDPGTFTDVGTEGTLGVFNHVIGLTAAGKLFHTIRTQDAWTPFVDVNAVTGSGSTLFTNVGLANVNGDLHVCATTSTGGVRHAIRSQNGSWSGFGDVLGQTGPAGSSVTDVDCTGIGSDMHISMTTSAGGLFHAIRFPNSWTSLGDVEVEAGELGSPKRVAVTTFVGELNLTTRTASNTQFHTMRHPQSWTQFATPMNSPAVTDQSCAATQDILHLVSIEGGAVRYQSRDTTLWSSVVGNVNAAAGNSPGMATSVGAATTLGF